jgi:hypothetical protein
VPIHSGAGDAFHPFKVVNAVGVLLAPRMLESPAFLVSSPALAYTSPNQITMYRSTKPQPRFQSDIVKQGKWQSK